MFAVVPLKLDREDPRKLLEDPRILLANAAVIIRRADKLEDLDAAEEMIVNAHDYLELANLSGKPDKDHAKLMVSIGKLVSIGEGLRGNTERARAVIKGILKADPDDKDAKEILRILEEE